MIVWINPEGIMLSKISQIGKGKYYMVSLIYEMTTSKKSQIIETERRMVVASEGLGGEGNRAKLVQGYKLAATI